ncbi:MAG: hypothetical protein ABSH15_03265 [Verrucomicrobiota bacterium]
MKNALAAQNTTASEVFSPSLFKNVPLRIKVLRELREEFDVLALPLLKAAQPYPVWPVPLTSGAAGLGQNKQLNPVLNEENRSDHQTIQARRSQRRPRRTQH